MIVGVLGPGEAHRRLKRAARDLAAGERQQDLAHAVVAASGVDAPPCRAPASDQPARGRTGGERRHGDQNDRERAHSSPPSRRAASGRPRSARRPRAAPPSAAGAAARAAARGRAAGRERPSRMYVLPALARDARDRRRRRHRTPRSTAARRARRRARAAPTSAALLPASGAWPGALYPQQVEVGAEPLRPSATRGARAAGIRDTARPARAAARRRPGWRRRSCPGRASRRPRSSAAWPRPALPPDATRPRAAPTGSRSGRSR